MDMAHVSQYFTLDVMSTIAFGEPFGYMAANKDLWGRCYVFLGFLASGLERRTTRPESLIGETWLGTSYSITICFAPGLHKYLPSITSVGANFFRLDYNKITAEFMLFAELASNHNFIRSIISSRPFQWLAAPKGTDKVGLGRIVGIAQKTVAERYRPDAKVKRDMLGHFLSKGLSQEQAEVESNVQILAGSDSTATVLRITLMFLIASPDAYAKLRTEIDDAVAAGNISHPVVTYAEAMKLPYLDAVIWEGMRLWPPLIGFLTKLAPKGGDTVNDIFYPEGTEICVCPMGVGRHKDIFGEDADIFRPDRWTEADAAARNKYERTTEVVFGSGRFTCLGKNIAMIELHKVFVEVRKLR
jgi:cytochrome P450